MRQVIKCSLPPCSLLWSSPASRTVRRPAPHHLVDDIQPWVSESVASWARVDYFTQRRRTQSLCQLGAIALPIIFRNYSTIQYHKSLIKLPKTHDSHNIVAWENKKVPILEMIHGVNVIDYSTIRVLELVFYTLLVSRGHTFIVIEA